MKNDSRQFASDIASRHPYNQIATVQLNMYSTYLQLLEVSEDHRTTVNITSIAST